MIYKCVHFAIHELVPRRIFEARGEKAWQLLDVNALITLDRLREKYGPITVNNYYWGGEREWSGLRTPNSPFYSLTSQHTYGRAFDCLFAETTADKVRTDLLINPNGLVAEFINTIEMGTSWLHFDTRNCLRIKTFKP